MDTTTDSKAAADEQASASATPWRARLAVLSFGNIGAIYVWAALIVLFAIWVPHLFLTANAVEQICNQYSISAIVALALVLPLSAGVYDLSVGSIMGLTGVVAGALLGHTKLPVAIVIILALAVGALCGSVNALIVWLGINSFIATLATGSIIAAITLGASGEQILTQRLFGSFSKLSSISVEHTQLPFLYMIIIAVLIGLLLSRTVLGRRIYATGFNQEAARLAGLSVGRIRSFSLVMSGLLAGFAGVALAARVQAADPSAGPSYLIPAFSAVFLGATQFGRGRFNALGTAIAVFMIGTGSYGLLLAGAPQWAPQLFQGVILVFAVGLTVFRVRFPRRRRAA
jgi:ribose transport system permease protein